MKIKCIYNINSNGNIVIGITIGKIYDTIRINEFGDYMIINDIGNERWYLKKWFKPLSEYRIEKINKLLKL
jgi:hypothetical protein